MLRCPDTGEPTPKQSSEVPREFYLVLPLGTYVVQLLLYLKVSTILPILLMGYPPSCAGEENRFPVHVGHQRGSRVRRRGLLVPFLRIPLLGYHGEVADRSPPAPVAIVSNIAHTMI